MFQSLDSVSSVNSNSETNFVTKYTCNKRKDNCLPCTNCMPMRVKKVIYLCLVMLTMKMFFLSLGQRTFRGSDKTHFNIYNYISQEYYQW